MLRSKLIFYIQEDYSVQPGHSSEEDCASQVRTVLMELLPSMRMRNNQLSFLLNYIAIILLLQYTQLQTIVLGMLEYRGRKHFYLSTV